MDGPVRGWIIDGSYGWPSRASVDAGIMLRKGLHGKRTIVRDLPAMIAVINAGTF